MRIGFNPNKNKKIAQSGYFHQVVIPVYIPNHDGYFKDSFDILKLCLVSLFKTSHKKTYITIVNNGSSPIVLEFLNSLLKEHKIQELIHVTNIGRINAMLKGIAGQNFDLITTSDADVLFLEGWQEATYQVFQNFSKCGVVCPTPSSKSFRYYTSNLYWDLLFSKKIKFREVINQPALKKFALSIDNKDFYNEIQLKKYLTISNNNQTAVAGAGHYVVTYRATIFNSLGNKSVEHVLGGCSNDVFDTTVLKKGFWRLSTADNFTYHMGNVIEDWMNEEVSKLNTSDRDVFFRLNFIKPESKLSYFIKSKLFGKIILNKKIMKIFLIWKGLSKEEALNYLK